MSFNCEQCKKEILDGDNDYYQGCEHYPVVQLMLRSSRADYIGRKLRNEGYIKPKLGELFINAKLLESDK